MSDEGGSIDEGIAEGYNRVREVLRAIPAQLDTLKTSKDIDEYIQRAREFILQQSGGIPLPPTSRKAQRELVSEFFLSWLLKFGEHPVDAKYEARLLIDAVKELKSKLPTDAETLHGKVNKLRREGKGWSDIAPKVYDFAPMPEWERKEHIELLPDANKKFNKRHGITPKRRRRKKIE
jgi:hypothetical protein